MAGVIVQSAVGTNTLTSYTTTYTTPSFSAATTAGHTIVVFFCKSNDNGLFAMTCTDGTSNTYTQKLASLGDTSTSGDEDFTVFYCENAVSVPSTNTFTISNPSTDYMQTILFEVSGLATSPAFLGANGSYQTGINASNTGLTTGSLAAGTGTCFVLSGSMNTLENGTAPFYPTVQSGITSGGTYFGTPTLAGWGYGNYSNLGTTPIKWTSSVNSSADNYVTWAIAFATAGGGSSTPFNVCVVTCGM